MSAKREDPRILPEADAEQAASAPVALSLRHLAIGLIAEAEEQVQRPAAGPVGMAGRAGEPGQVTSRLGPRPSRPGTRSSE
jgi:hypothetical protein